MTGTTNVRLVNKLLEQMEGPWGRSSSTCYKYRQGYKTFLGWIDKPLVACTTHDLELYLARRPAAASTTAWELAILQTLYRFLHEHLGVVGSNPAKVLVKPKVHNEAPKPVPDELWRRVWAAPLFDDERVMLGLGYFVGLRRAEITGLQVDQFIDVPAPLITGVLRKGGKRQGMRWESCISLYRQKLPDLLGDPELFNGALARLRTRPPHAHLLPWRDSQETTGGNDHGGQFPGRGRSPQQARTTSFQVQSDTWRGHIPPDTMNDRLRSLCTRLGLAERATTPHQLRHSFGTNLCRARVPVEVVSRLMGHASVKVTMRYVETGDDPLALFLSEDSANDDQELRPVRRW